MTKTTLKKIAQTALESEFGFAPAISNITLLEANGEGTYILFSVKGKDYRFESRLLLDKTIWVGKGTIERVTEV